MGAATRRYWIALGAYTVGIPAAYLHPAVSLVIIGGISGLYFIPDVVKWI
jgi:hypothetical protein